MKVNVNRQDGHGRQVHGGDRYIGGQVTGGWLHRGTGTQRDRYTAGDRYTGGQVHRGIGT